MAIRVGFFVLLLVLLAGASAYLVFPLLQYVLGAALLAFVFTPAHERLSSVRIELEGRTMAIGPRFSAGVLTLFGVFVAVIPLLFVSVILLQTVRTFIEDFSESDVSSMLLDVGRGLGLDDEQMIELEARLVSEVETTLDIGFEIVLQEMFRLMNVSIRVAVGLLVLVFLLYYFLLDGPRLVAWIGTVLPFSDHVRDELFAEIDVVTWAVVKSHVLVALTEGILGGIGLYLVGVPNVAFWTFVMVVVSFLPVLGVWLIWFPAVVYLFAIGEQTGAIVLLIYGVAVLSVVDNYLRAILVNRGSEVHPAIVLVGVIGGLYLFGILGLFLGPVLLAVFKGGLQVFGDVYDPDEGSSSLS